jgi:hypothetical protein
MLSLKHLFPAVVASLALAAPAVAQDVNYELINNSPLTLMEFYSSPSDVGSWEEDILGANVLGSGQSGSVVIADGRENCVYDLLFVFEDGQTLEDTVDICALASYTIE